MPGTSCARLWRWWHATGVTGRPPPWPSAGGRAERCRRRPCQRILPQLCCWLAKVDASRGVQARATLDLAALARDVTTEHIPEAAIWAVIDLALGRGPVGPRRALLPLRNLISNAMLHGPGECRRDRAGAGRRRGRPFPRSRITGIAPWRPPAPSAGRARPDRGAGMGLARPSFEEIATLAAQADLGRRWWARAAGADFVAGGGVTDAAFFAFCTNQGLAKG